MSDNIVHIKRENGKLILQYNDLKVPAYIGKNGFTNDKKEGDLKTVVGEFDLGTAFGKHERDEIDINEDIPYFKIKDSHYWVDDINSDNYNELIESEEKPSISGEHLADYKDNAYEYAINIKANPENIKGKGSAIFLHINRFGYTSGCIAISKGDMLKLISMIDSKTRIKIDESLADDNIKKEMM